MTYREATPKAARPVIAADDVGEPKTVHAQRILNALPHPMLSIGKDGAILEANAAAESFFDASQTVLSRHHLSDLLPFGSPLLALLDQVRERGAAVNEYRVNLGTPRIGLARIVDIHAAPMVDSGEGVVALMLMERTIADKMDRQMTPRGAARSVSALASMLAHEIKNPLSGIRGAARWLESSVGDEDRAFAQRIGG